MDISTKQSIGWDKARDFLEKLIDEYKYGEISADDVCSKADDFFSSHTVYCGRDEDLRRVVEEILPETLKTYKETTSDDDKRMLNFWKGLKDCDHLLYFGRTYTEEIEEYLETGLDRADPVEYTDRFLAIEPELEKLIREETGEGGYLGYCHYYWSVKKRILKERYGIDWKSTADRFPGVMFD